jgi:hypothetical protein
MNIEFHWSSCPISGEQDTIETEIREVLQHSNLQQCHPGQTLVFLAVGGRENATLTGSVKCRCGQTIATFRGDSRTSKIDIIKKEQIPAQ